MAFIKWFFIENINSTEIGSFFGGVIPNLANINKIFDWSVPTNQL